MASANTLPAPADRIVSLFISELSELDFMSIEGIYLTGSITLADFYPQKSDIDFLVIIKVLPNRMDVGRLKELHFRIERQCPGPKLSGFYITPQSLSNHQNAVALSYNQGKMRFEKSGMAPVYLFELKSNGIAIQGPSSETLRIEISMTGVNQFLFDNINSYWKEWIRRHSSILNRRLLLLLFPRLTEWVILGVARQLFTLQTGKIVSKTEAGVWIRSELPVQFHEIVDEAIRIRRNTRTYPLTGSYGINLSFRRAEQTIDCIQYMIELFNRRYSAKRS